jgi:pSer/pThr/pTyr-binding forkhead associated (FHA) protein
MIRALDLEAQPPGRIILRATTGPSSGQAFVLARAGGILGRAAENGVAIPDERLSRRHARIRFDDGAFWIGDLGSRNGTNVNDQPLTEPRRLQAGDRITLGGTQLHVALEAE